MILLSTDDTPTQQLLNEEIPRQFLDQASREGVTEVGDWQALDVSDKPQGRTIELRNAIFEYHIPKTKRELEFDIRPNMPFAEAQFQDRVSGQPLNPPPSFDLWPWKRRGEEHQDKGGRFSHTYPERLWPKRAGMLEHGGNLATENFGIMGPLGDLNDAIALLAKKPSTRQCYIPLWFPEDGRAALDGVRVPCSLGWWLVLRDRQLHMSYLIRSVDFIRHFRDDVFLACRLCQWILSKLHEKGSVMSDEPFSAQQFMGVHPGTLTMWMGSFHCFEGDLPSMRRKLGLA